MSYEIDVAQLRVYINNQAEMYFGLTEVWNRCLKELKLSKRMDSALVIRIQDAENSLDVFAITRKVDSLAEPNRRSHWVEDTTVFNGFLREVLDESELPDCIWAERLDREFDATAWQPECNLAAFNTKRGEPKYAFCWGHKKLMKDDLSLKQRIINFIRG